MNERIVELFMQSVDSNYIPLPIEDHMPSWTEKFAELIVQECANELLKWQSEPFPLDPVCAARIIKEHFGVK